MGGDLVENAGDGPGRALLGGRVGERWRGIEDVAPAVLDFRDQIRAVSGAVVGENGVGGGDLPRRGFPRAEEGRGVFRHRRGEAGHPRDFLDAGDAGEISDADGHGVAGADEAVGNRLHAVEFAVGILRPPGAAAFDLAALDRVVADAGVRAQAAVEGG